MHNFQRMVNTLKLQVRSHEKWIVQLDVLTGFIKQTVEFLKNYSEKVSQKISGYRYPFSGYLKAWTLLHERVDNAVKRFKQKQNQVLLSAILNWAMTAFGTGYNDLWVFIQKQTKQLSVDDEPFSPNVYNQLNEEFKLQSSFKLKGTDVRAILQLPFLYIDRLKQRLISFTEALQIRATLQTSLLEEKSRLPQVLSKQAIQVRAKRIQNICTEVQQLKKSVDHLNTVIEFLNKSDEYGQRVNRENSLLVFNIVSKQYDQIPKSKLAMNYVYRLKLICRWNKLRKNQMQRLQQRKMNIKQLIDGEQRYVRNLAQYISTIKDPIIALGILNEQQKRMLFSSIVEIRDFHISLLKVLQTEYDNYSDHQLYGKILKTYIPFFKLYTDYILNASVASKYLQDLIKSVKEVERICEKFSQSTSKLAYNVLYQPSFRIARYQMLFQRIIKNTSKENPDYVYLSEVLKSFKNTLSQINNDVDKILRQNRLNQLQREYGIGEVISKQKKEKIKGQNEERKFIHEYSLTWIKEHKSKQVILIILSDLLLLVEEDSKKLLKTIVVDKNVFARREDDNKLYKNMITIHSDGFMTFTAGWEENKSYRAEEIYQTLKQITKESGEQVVVQVLGTEEIGSTSFAKYTEYIIEIKLRDMKKTLHMRFSEIISMVSMMQTHYKNDLKITEEQNMKKTWLSSHSSKIIETRKIIVPHIFMKLFNNELIKVNPQYFLNYLHLPDNFYQIAELSYQKRISLSESVTVNSLRRAILAKQQEKDMLTILCETKIKLDQDLFKGNDNEEELRKLKQNAQKVQIQILTQAECQLVMVQIGILDTVEDVCKKISKTIGLRQNRDFRLFHEIGKKELRVLDHEQILNVAFKFYPQKKTKASGFFDTIKNAVNKIVSSDAQPTLVFKKYYYLPYEIEQSEMRKDLTRLRLMVYQVFSEICEMKYQLNFDEYLLFLSALLYITAEGKAEGAAQADPLIVHRVIPSTIFNLKDYSEEEWIAKCNHHIWRLHKEILKVIQQNREQLQAKTIKVDTISKMALYFSHKHICCQIVINKIKSNPIQGSNLFYVQLHPSCYKKLQQQGLKVAYNMWLAVKIQSLNLLSPTSKQLILEIKFNEIESLNAYSECIVIRKSGITEVDYRLNTYQSFEISQLVKYNKALTSTLTEIKDDSSLKARVKEYRQQLKQAERLSKDTNQFGD